MENVVDESGYIEVRTRLTEILIDELYGCDLEWVDGGKLVGLPEIDYVPQPNRGLSGQRGWR